MQLHRHSGWRLEKVVKDCRNSSSTCSKENKFSWQMRSGLWPWPGWLFSFLQVLLEFLLHFKYRHKYYIALWDFDTATSLLPIPVSKQYHSVLSASQLQWCLGSTQFCWRPQAHCPLPRRVPPQWVCTCPSPGPPTHQLRGGPSGTHKNLKKSAFTFLLNFKKS